MSKELEIVSVKLNKYDKLMADRAIESPEDAVALLGDFLRDMDREVLCVVNLRADGVPINCNIVSVGALNETVAHPREILKSSILSNAASILIVHNHPSGSLIPSQADTMMTDRMIKVCNYMGIPLRDHIIVGGSNDGYFSFKTKGLLKTEDIMLVNNYRDISFDDKSKDETITKGRKR